MSRKFTPKTWIKIASVSAAAFAVAMVCITALEFGTNKPISSLVTASTTSSSDTGAQTTFGAAFSSSEQNPDDVEQPVDSEPSGTSLDDGTGSQEDPGTGTAPDVVEEGSSTGLAEPGSGDTGGSVPVETSSEVVPVPVPEPGTEVEPAPGVETPVDSESDQQPQGETGTSP